MRSAHSQADATEQGRKAGTRQSTLIPIIPAQQMELPRAAHLPQRPFKHLPLRTKWVCWHASMSAHLQTARESLRKANSF